MCDDLGIGLRRKLVTQALSSSRSSLIFDMPLWTIARPSSEMCDGRALAGTPWVAQRVWRCDFTVVGVCSSAFSSIFTLPTVRSRESSSRSVPPGQPSRSAILERRSPSMRMGTMFRSAIAPTIPHNDDMARRSLRGGLSSVPEVVQ